MKIRLGIVIVALTLPGCSSEPVAPGFDIKQNTGTWIPYEIVYSDGSTSTGPFHHLSVFGAYDPGIQLNDDGTYFPLNWLDGEDEPIIDTQEGGSYEYLADESKLVLTNSFWEMEFEVAQFKIGELWLTALLGEQNIYKLRKAPID